MSFVPPPIAISLNTYLFDCRQPVRGQRVPHAQQIIVTPTPLVM